MSKFYYNYTSTNTNLGVLPDGHSTNCATYSTWAYSPDVDSFWSNFSIPIPEKKRKMEVEQKMKNKKKVSASKKRGAEVTKRK